jgi:hypothetical protein
MIDFCPGCRICEKLGKIDRPPDVIRFMARFGLLREKREREKEGRCESEERPSTKRGLGCGKIHGEVL